MAGEFDNNLYCDFNGAATRAVAGKDIVLAVFNAAGDKLLAIAGQQGLTITRSRENIEVSTKDLNGGWKSKLSGTKEWSIENDGLFVPSDEAHKSLSKAFTDDEYVCLKVIDAKSKKAMFGGLALLSEYTVEAPYDDAMTYSATFDGCGELADLTGSEAGTMPAGAETV